MLCLLKSKCTSPNNKYVFWNIKYGFQTANMCLWAKKHICFLKCVFWNCKCVFWNSNVSFRNVCLSKCTYVFWWNTYLCFQNTYLSFKRQMCVLRSEMCLLMKCVFSKRHIPKLDLVMYCTIQSINGFVILSIRMTFYYKSEKYSKI